jgi:hypothetical protein
MHYLPLLALLLPAAALAQSGAIPRSNTPVVGKVKSGCVPPGARRVGDVPPPAARKLGDMPPAKPIYTVVREIDGCPVPVSVRSR